jgi:predicted N-formylglutamate amidohydrolase
MFADATPFWRHSDGVRSLPLLSPDDPPPVRRTTRPGDWLFTVEHAGRAVPAALGDLGLPAGEIDRHIGWDPGASDLAHALLDRLGGVLVEQPYSRLVIDCNRPWGSPTLIPEISDESPVPANQRIEGAARHARWNEIHQPYQSAVAAEVRARPRSLVSVHTYDPQRRTDAAPRPWPVGLLWRQDNPLATALAAALASDPGVLPLGINQPYSIDDASDYALPVHAEPAGLPHVLIEVRNDYLKTPDAVAEMADRLAAALNAWTP